ncbi:MAG: F0F1 ATP synthase subunit B [Lachnospiraceae bacterium]
MDGRIFGLDLQLGFDVLFQAICVFLLFVLLSYILFEPVKKVLKERQQRVADSVADAARNQEEAQRLKQMYEEKLRDVKKEADTILSDARKKGMEKEQEIVSNAKEEASLIMKRAQQEIQLEKNKLKDDVRTEMIDVATVLAGKIMEESMDDAKQDALIEKTLKEMGDDTWLD